MKWAIVMKLSMWAEVGEWCMMVIFSHSQGQGHVGDDRQSLTGLIFSYRYSRLCRSFDWVVENIAIHYGTTYSTFSSWFLVGTLCARPVHPNAIDSIFDRRGFFQFLIFVSSSGQCFQCGEKVTGASDACQAMSNLYHTSCFVCSSCGKSKNP